MKYEIVDLRLLRLKQLKDESKRLCNESMRLIKNRHNVYELIHNKNHDEKLFL